MDSSCTYNNRSDRVRGAVIGMECGSVGLDCRPPEHGALCSCHHNLFQYSL